MQYTIFTSEGHWLASVECSFEADVPNLQSNQKVVSGGHPENTILINDQIVEATGASLDLYNEKLLYDIRQERDKKLSQSDWTQFNDSPLDNTKKQEWATYRQALRDLPANTTDPANPTWPTKPT